MLCVPPLPPPPPPRRQVRAEMYIIGWWLVTLHNVLGVGDDTIKVRFRAS